MFSERDARIEVARRYEKLIIIKIISDKNKPGTRDKLQMRYSRALCGRINFNIQICPWGL